MKRTNQLTKRGPFPGSDENDLTFVAEQVSHHPPVSAFYAEHPGKRVSFTAHIWTKSSFLGLSIGNYLKSFKTFRYYFCEYSRLHCFLRKIISG